MKSYKGVKPNLEHLFSLRAQAKGLSFFKKQVVNAVNAGSHQSKAKGRGMDFDEVRHYQAGDDIRLMHWSLTARLGKPYTKVYKEERERNLYFILDQRKTMRFGTRECFKSVKAVDALAMFGFGALSANEKVGGVVFDDNGCNYYPASQNSSALVRAFNNTIEPNDSYQISTQDAFAEALKILYAKIKSNSVIVVLSDFYRFDDNVARYMKLLMKSNQIINVFCYDQIEKHLPKKGVYSFSDGQHFIELDATDKKQMRNYANIYDYRYSTIKDFSIKHKISFFALATNDDLIKSINYGLKGNATN